MSKGQSAENWLKCVGLCSGPTEGTVQYKQHAANAELMNPLLHIDTVTKACLILSIRQMNASHACP